MRKSLIVALISLLFIRSSWAETKKEKDQDRMEYGGIARALMESEMATPTPADNSPADTSGRSNADLGQQGWGNNTVQTQPLTGNIQPSGDDSSQEAQPISPKQPQDAITSVEQQARINSSSHPERSRQNIEQQERIKKNAEKQEAFNKVHLAKFDPEKAIGDMPPNDPSFPRINDQNIPQSARDAMIAGWKMNMLGGMAAQTRENHLLPWSLRDGMMKKIQDAWNQEAYKKEAANNITSAIVKANHHPDKGLDKPNQIKSKASASDSMGEEMRSSMMNSEETQDVNDIVAQERNQINHEAMGQDAHKDMSESLSRSTESPSQHREPNER